MIERFCYIIILSAAVSLGAHELSCGSAIRSAAPAESAGQRKYAPARQVDMLHLKLEVTPDFRARSVAGKATLRFKALEELRELKLDAEELRITAVQGGGGAGLRFQNTGKQVLVYFEPPVRAETEQEISIEYSAFPTQGLYFRTREMGYKAEDEHIFTQGEDIEARHWFPCFDHPNEKFTSEIICHVPSGMTVLSNGRMVEERATGEGLKAVHWLQDKPHVSYLISLVAGNFKRIEDEYNGMSLAFYTPSSQIEHAQTSFAETKEMMGYFEREIGFPYPWDKYYQVCVQDFMFGGMENTSISTLTDRTLFPAEMENVRSSQDLVAHELAHQWFGDLVTCKDWSHAWLNEGFASYYAHLYNGHKDGRDEFLYGLFNSARGFIGRSSLEDMRPTVYRQYDRPVEVFGHLIYNKGAWILHMLREQMGPELFRKAVQKYLEDHKFGTVVTHDLVSAVEAVSGQSYEQFFDQWVYRPHHPELQISYSWDEAAKLALVTVTQTQLLTNEISLFRFPLLIRFIGKNGVTERKVEIREKKEIFHVALDAAPDRLRIDPELALLAKINYQPPRPMLVAQLKDEKDVIGRVLAVQQLGKSKDVETVQLLKERLNQDPFFGVRREAAEALRDIGSPEALAALLESAEQKDARVREKVAAEIGRFYDPKALQFALGRVEQESNPSIRADLIRTLGAYGSAEVRKALREQLLVDSYENIVAEASISAMRAQNEPGYLPAILHELRGSQLKFDSRGYAAALDAVAYLARNGKDKTEVFELLAAETMNLRREVRLGALQGLGTLQDERAIAVLSKWVSGATDLPESGRANRALEAVRNARPVVQELQNLRGEVLELKKENRELNETVEELKKKVEAALKPAAPVNEKKKSVKKR